jgi:hypothetical protein
MIQSNLFYPATEAPAVPRPYEPGGWDCDFSSLSHGMGTDMGYSSWGQPNPNAPPSLPPPVMTQPVVPVETPSQPQESIIASLPSNINLQVPHVAIEQTPPYPIPKPEESADSSDVKCRVIDAMCEFADANRRNEWPASTSSYCKWCCHPFLGPPVAIPRWYTKGVFYVTGNYCSYSCAASHLFDSQNKDKNDCWEQYSLLHLLRKKILQQSEMEKIDLAPPRDTLRIFGGHLTVEEFRDQTKETHGHYKVFKILHPPLIAMVPKIEEQRFYKSKEERPTVRDRHTMQYVAPRNEEYLRRQRWGKARPFIPVDESRIKQAEENLRIRRKKPLLNKEKTLFNYMNLKVKGSKKRAAKKPRT